MMKKIFMCGLLILCAALIAIAQDKPQADANKKPDLSGVWIPQVEKQRKPNAAPTDWTNVIIVQHDAEVKFTLIYPPGAKPPKREFTFYTDGRGETNSGTVYYFQFSNGASPDDEIKSNTSWDGNALVVVHKMVTHSGAITITSDLIMRWEVSPDGKTLTRTMKETNHSGTYVQHTADGDKLLKLPVDVRGATGETKDTYLLLETKR